MQTGDDLERLLEDVDRRPYPAYKRLRGTYDLGWFELEIVHVQGDPFAAPSSLAVRVSHGETGLTEADLASAHRRRAVEDLLVRRLARELRVRSLKVGGSGKSGLLATSRPGPEVLTRSACEVDEDGVTLRLHAGFPARGRTTDGRALAEMLLDLVPEALDATFDRDALPGKVRGAVELADDQHAIREELSRRGLVAFVADGSVLPRASGVSSAPLADAKPFCAPDSLAVELELPHAGRVRGMGVPEGVTLIVGGGYHGKSTLLRALQEGVYDHVASDGRELVTTRPDAVKLRAEDGRPVRDTDVSAFIGSLPDGRDARRFSTTNASGSTSQAASTVEAVSAGCRTLFVDEDTSATNFMVRDELMEAVVPRSCEPITPFVERVRGLWEREGVSSVIVVGSSGAFFPAADMVIQMQGYEPRDLTARVREVCRERELSAADGGEFSIGSDRGLTLPTPKAAGGGRGHRGPSRPKARSRGLDEVSVGDGSADIRLLEQLVDPEQASAIALLVREGFERGLLDGSRSASQVADELLEELLRHGWETLAPSGDVPCDLALPRPEELDACLLRWRE